MKALCNMAGLFHSRLGSSKSYLEQYCNVLLAWSLSTANLLLLTGLYGLGKNEPWPVPRCRAERPFLEQNSLAPLLCTHNVVTCSLKRSLPQGFLCTWREPAFVNVCFKKWLDPTTCKQGYIIFIVSKCFKDCQSRNNPIKGRQKFRALLFTILFLYICWFKIQKSVNSKSKCKQNNNKSMG